MKFIKKWAINLIVMVILFVGMFFIFPEIFGLVYDFLLQLFGPWLLLIALLVSAMPKKPIPVKIVKD